MNPKIRRLFALVATLFLLSCDQSSQGEFNFPVSTASGLLEEIRRDGELVVLTRNAPTTYYEGNEGPAGFEYDLVIAFAKHMHLTPRFVMKDSTAEILKALAKGEGVLAAAGLTKTEARAKRFLFSPEYQSVQQQVICRRDGVKPADEAELVGLNLWVTSSSSYIDTLHKLKASYPDLMWTESHDYDTEQLLEQVWQKKIDCTIADSNIVAINRRYYPELEIAFDLSQGQSLTWLMPSRARDLQQAVNQWFEDFKLQGELDHVINQHYGYIEIFDYVDMRRFKKRIKNRLPKYLEFFQQAATEQELSWTLLAAQSYQESHWQARARSPTGVRGIMMLTLTTAKELGITNRINPKNSIFGGAKYLKQLNSRVPEEIDEPDRTWVALAAYNVGMGHIHDARTLAAQLGKNPNKWTDLAEVLPLLSQKKYYKTLKYGYARGNEPVRYVQRIRDFKNILDREFDQNNVKTANTENKAKAEL